MPLARSTEPIRRWCAGVLAAACVPACIYVPVNTAVYDADCHVYARHMELGVTQVGGFARCVNESCVALLAAAGAVSAASAVVSGSIVVTGNVVYWFEKQGRCTRAAPAPASGGQGG